MSLKGYLLFGFLLGTTVIAVDFDTFRTCAQSDFCSRLRNKTNQNDFVVDEGSISITPVSVSMLLNHRLTKQTLNLTITAVIGDIFRVTIDEVGGGRYHLKDVLEKEPQLVGIRVELGENITVVAGNNRIVAHESLVMDFYKGTTLVSSLNPGHRFTFENETDKRAVAFHFVFAGAVRAYGLPEHGDKLALRTTKPGGADPYRLYNLDVANHILESPMALYGSIPVLYGHGTTHTSGVFFHNAAEQWVEITNNQDSVEAYFMAESGVIDLFVLLGTTPKDAVKQYASLTGVAPLPQLWTLGYHQCRWNYDNQSDVKNVIALLDKHDFPVDVIWLDIEYTDGKRYFTWDPTHFSNPQELLANLSSTNRKLVTIIDPHIKVDENYVVYKGLKDRGYFVKNPNGSDFEGDCWPGRSSYVDFFNPAASDYYGSWYSYDRFNGTNPTLGGIWNDMNEPSVFDDTIEKTFPKNLVHHGGITHRDVHNAYGFQQTKATYKGLIQRDNGTKRPFILTRSHFAGSQRYTAMWTGDNTASWEFLRAGYQMCLSENLAGITFCGADVGGFFGNPDVELLQRWYQAGIWLPFFRAHANMGTDRREPYLFPEDVQKRIRTAIKERYAHLPTWYTLFYEHHRNGEPIIRPLFYEYPQNTLEVADIDDQIFVGSNIMVKAVTEPSVKTVPVYFPGGTTVIWYDLQNGFAYRGLGLTNVNVTLDYIPMFYKSGTIVTRRNNERRNTHDMRNDKYHVYIQLDENGEANGTIYLDDTESFGYQNKQYRYLSLTYANDVFSVTLIDKDADYPQGDFSVEYLVVTRPPTKTNEGVQFPVQSQHIRATSEGVELSRIAFDSSKTTTVHL